MISSTQPFIAANRNFLEVVVDSSVSFRHLKREVFVRPAAMQAHSNLLHYTTLTAGESTIILSQVGHPVVS